MKKSPFPGMDPFLEGSVWHAVHNGLIYQLATMLSEKVPDDLFVDTEVKTILVDEIGEEFRQMYPDVAVYNARRDDEQIVQEPVEAYGSAPATLTIAHLPVKTQSLKIIELGSRRVITTIEVVSPVNKFGQGYADYQSKVEDKQLAGVNVLEVDLIRRGKRKYPATNRESAPYVVQLFEAANHRTKVWLLQLNERLPELAIPLRHNDQAVRIDLQSALNTFYAERRMGKLMDYGAEVPPPELTEAQRIQVNELLSDYR